MKLLSRVQLFATPWTVAYKAPPSMGFSKQKYWSGLPFPSLEILHKEAIKLMAAMIIIFFTIIIANTQSQFISPPFPFSNSVISNII